MTADSAKHDRSAARLGLSSNASGYVLAGLAIIAIGLGSAAAWASLAPLHSAVVASGVVAVHSKRKEIQHLEGGTVEAILISDGDRVTAGDVLLRLDETRPLASLEILSLQYDSALAVEARLLAEHENATDIAFPAELVSRANEPGPATLMAGQLSLLEARRATLTGKAEILGQRIVQLDEEVAGLAAQIKAKDRQVALIGEELQGLRKLFKQGHAPRTRILALEREEAKLLGERGELSAETARARAAKGETEMQIIQIKQEFREAVVAELREVRQQIFDLRERIGAARRVLDNIELKAPVAGRVVGLKVHTLGSVIGQGETLLEIVPEGDRLVIEARVRPIDIDSLSIGQEAAVHISAFKRRTAPVLNGTLSYVSADAMTDDGGGAAYYQVRIEIAPAELERLRDGKLQPGMPAEVMVRTGWRTALHYLAQPILDSARRAWRED